MVDKKKVLVVGGGFAGINIVKNLDTSIFDVILIDKINHHQFQPLFYQVATSQIEPSNISFPLRFVFRNKKDIRIRLALATSFDHTKKILYTSIGEFPYDYLILALGCETNFFGNKVISENALTLKSTYDAIAIRNKILQVFEDIINSGSSPKESLFNIVVVGAGPTGVELAGAFAEIKNKILPKDYHRIDFSKLRIFLLEGGKNTLSSMSQNAQEKSRIFLEKLGVEIMLETFVKNYDGENLETVDGRIIKTNTVIWTAGVIAHKIEGFEPSDIVRGNRIKVDRYNRVLNMQDVFVLGDMAYMETSKYPKGHAQIANVAINQGVNLAKNLKKICLNKESDLVPYEYKDLGAMATVGENKAVVDFPKFKFSGKIAWFVWMFLHLMLILSARNKIIIFINWAWAYISKNTALRIILKNN